MFDTKVTKHTGYFDFGYSCVPYYFISENEIVLFDSGIKERPDIFDALDEEGLKVVAVLHTHLHRDHMANNHLIYKRYRAAFYADVAEIEFAQQEHLAGKDENFRFFDKSLFTAFDHATQSLSIKGTAFQLYPTHGHSIGHTAFITPDRVMITGDCFVSQDVLHSSRLPFIANIEKGIAAMLSLAETDYPFYIPAHKGVVKKEDLRDLLFQNILLEGKITLFVAELADTPLTLLELQKKVFQKLHLTHLKDTEWVRYMVNNHIEKALDRNMIIEKDGFIRRP